MSDAQILKQVEYAFGQSWAVSVEFTDDPHPRNSYWSMWGLPLFEVKDPEAVLFEVNKAREKLGKKKYIKIVAFDNTRGVESAVMSYIVNRPSDYEPGFRLIRAELEGRKIGYTLSSYSVDKNPIGDRY